MEHPEGSDFKESKMAKISSMIDEMKRNVNSSEVVKEPKMEELEIIAPMRSTDSSDIVKESATEKSDTIATRNLDSSKVGEELAMEEKPSPAETNWKKLPHAPWGKLRRDCLVDGAKSICRCVGCEFKRKHLRCQPGQAKFVRDGDTIYFSLT